MSKASLEKLALDLCWRQWTTLGVAGVVRQQGAAVIDPEALILFTAALGDTDPRLTEEAIDWCITNGAQVVSMSRLKNLMPSPVNEPIGRFLATVNEHARERWPVPKGCDPWTVDLSGKSKLPRAISTPALARVQLRAIFGVSARAELLLAFLADPHIGDKFVSAPDIRSTGYSRRNLAFVLDDLQRAGILDRRASGKQVRYRLVTRKELEALASCTPTAVLVRWDLVFEAVLAAMRFSTESSKMPPKVRSINANKLIKNLGEVWDGLHVTPPSPIRGQEEDYATIVSQWFLESFIPIAWR